MGGTKPKTGGLAALLRIEKERLAREASEEYSSPPPHKKLPETTSPEGANDISVTAGVLPINKKDDIITTDSAEEGLSHSNGDHTDSHVNEEVISIPPGNQTSDRFVEAAEVDEESASGKSFGSVEREQPPPVPVSMSSEASPSSHLALEQRIKHLSQNVRPDVKGTGSNRLVVKKGRAKTHSGKQHKFISTNLPPELQTFVDRWKPFLTETQLNVCIHVYNNSTGLGLEYCFTSTPKLMSVVSKTERQVKTVLDQLINLNFINRGETVINAPRENRGTFYKLNLDKS
ncbi:MAG TPA: hypothetical protein VF762_20115 [Blastocatellia bacterium]|jgi:hypothetical protein